MAKTPTLSTPRCRPSSSSPKEPHTKKILFAAAALAVLAGCSAVKTYEPAEQADPLLTTVNFTVDSLAAQLKPLKVSHPLVVASAQNNDDLSQVCPQGRLLAEMVSSRLTQQGFPVSEVKLAKDMKVSLEGETILSRDLKKLATEVEADTVVAATWTTFGKEVKVGPKAATDSWPLRPTSPSRPCASLTAACWAARPSPRRWPGPASDPTASCGKREQPPGCFSRFWASHALYGVHATASAREGRFPTGSPMPKLADSPHYAKRLKLLRLPGVRALTGALLAGPAVATQYYAVTPLNKRVPGTQPGTPGPTEPGAPGEEEEGITMTLNSATLPRCSIDSPYSFAAIPIHA